MPSINASSTPPGRKALTMCTLSADGPLLCSSVFVFSDDEFMTYKQRSTHHACCIYVDYKSSTRAPFILSFSKYEHTGTQH